MRNRKVVLVAAALALAVTTTAHAAPIDLIDNNAFGESWLTAGDWSDDSVPTPGNDYHVGTIPGVGTLRSPNDVTDPVFGGNSLTMYGGSTLGLKHIDTADIPTLNLDGGTIGQWVGNRTMAIDGTITIQSNSQLESSGADRTMVLMGTLQGGGNLTTTGSAGTIRLLTDNTGYTGEIILGNHVFQLDANALTDANGFTAPAGLRVGANGNTATFTVSGGPVIIGGDFWVGHRDQAGLPNNSQTDGIADFSGSTSVTITADNVQLGTIANIQPEGWARGTLDLSATGPNLIEATNFYIGNSEQRGNTSVTSQVNLGGGNNTIRADNIRVGGRKSRGNLILAPGGHLDLTNRAGSGGADIEIAYNTPGTGTQGAGTIDTAAGTADIVASNIAVGHRQGGGGSATAIYRVADGSTTVAGDLRELGDGNASSTIEVLGNHTMAVGGVVAVDDFRIGYNTVPGTLTWAGGPANIGAGFGDLDVARRDASIAAYTQGTLDLSAASSVNIDVGNFRIGTIANVASEGGTEGIVNLSLAGANSITAATVYVGDTPARGNGPFVHQLNLGAADNTIRADELRVGGRKSEGTLTLAPGGSLDLAGRTGGRGDLFIGYNPVGSTGSAVDGIMDLSAGAQFNALLDQLVIGDKGDMGTNGWATGQLLLADANVIDANSILLGRSGNAGATAAQYQSHILLGNDNTIRTSSLTVGERKTSASIEFAAPGGLFRLEGQGGGRADVLLSNVNVNTGANGVGTLDATGGTLEALLGNVVLGHKSGGGTGTGTGNLLLGTSPDTSVEATSIVLGETAGSIGNLEFHAGALKVGHFSFGAGTANFVWTGGRFSPDVYAMALTQTAGTLAPGYTAGSFLPIDHGTGQTDVLGPYSLMGGTLEFDLMGAVLGVGYDHLAAQGDAYLDSLVNVHALMNVYALNTVYDVLTAPTITLGPSFLLGNTDGTLGGMTMEMKLIDGGLGQILRITLVPEPGTLILLGAGLAALRRRRK